MADISKISPDGGTTKYNIKDATARSGLGGKADKVASATNGNFAGLDANGNLTDSGKRASDFATASSVTTIEGKIPSTASPSNKLATADDVASRVPWSANAVLGVHNFFDINKYNSKTGGVSYTISDNSIMVQSTALTNQYILFDMNLPQNTDMTVMCAVAYTSGKGLVVVTGSNDGSTWDNVKVGTEFNASGTQKYTFNTGNYSMYQLKLFVTRSTATTGDITFSNILVKFTADTVDDYSDYAMTNQQLTERFNTGEYISTGVTVNTNKLSASSSGRLTRYGKICVFSAYITGENALVKDDVLFTLPPDCVSITNQWATTASNTSGKQLNIYLTTDSNEVRANGAFSVADYNHCQFQIVFVIK